jgi:hypothetical protein
MYTKSEIAEMITRPYNPPAHIRDKMVANFCNLSDKEIMELAQKYGLDLTRIREGQFIFEKIS